MTTQARRRPEESSQPTVQSEQGPRSDNDAGSAGDAFLEAADLAIERALSGSPEAFLEQNRQVGGQ
jgi:hypothetical protein